MQFYGISICQAMIFTLYTVYSKHEMIKIGNQTREASIIVSARIILLPIVQHPVTHDHIYMYWNAI